MSTPSKLLDFFTLEATEYLSRIESSLRADPPDVAGLKSGARGLRGSATMARSTPISNLAGRIEAIAAKVSTGEIQLDSRLRRTLGSAAETLAFLVRSVRSWAPEHDERTRRSLDDLDSYAPANGGADEDLIVPIGELFYSDAGPHIVEVAASARTTFEQRLRDRQAKIATPPASSSPSRSRSSALRGSALRDALGSSIAQMRSIERPGEPAAETIVPIQSLLYRGESAVGRSKELRSQILGARTPPSREMIAELCDLVELASAE
jgi:chemotaxis protein histidine kinase CheA